VVEAGFVESSGIAEGVGVGHLHTSFVSLDPVAQGFLFLHMLFVSKGRLEAVWQVLRTFDYDEHLYLKSTAVDLAPFRTSSRLPSLLPQQRVLSRGRGEEREGREGRGQRNTARLPLPLYPSFRTATVRAMPGLCRLPCCVRAACP